MKDIDHVRERAAKIFIAFRNQLNITCSLVDIPPGEKWPTESIAVRIKSIQCSADRMADRMQHDQPAIKGYVQDNAYCIDMGAVGDTEVPAIIETLRKIVDAKNSN
jgi:hypothetical protein